MRSATIAAALLACVSMATAATPSRGGGGYCLEMIRAAVSAVVLHLVDHAKLSPSAREEMYREAADPWRAAGMDVRWSGRGEDGGASDNKMAHVRVHLLRGREAGAAKSVTARRGQLASIPFVDGKPAPLITAHPAEVERLANVGRLTENPFLARPGPLQDFLIGRVLGRAVAHELGHFLFRSADHASLGLMRASHRIDDLLSPLRHDFTVVAPSSLPCIGAVAHP